MNVVSIIFSTSLNSNMELKKQTLAVLERSVARGDIEAKIELARRLLKGKGVDKDETKGAAVLEECAALGCAKAIFMLATCCIFGHGTERNLKRAKTLITDAAEKGLSDAKTLNRFIKEWDGRESVEMECLLF